MTYLAKAISENKTSEILSALRLGLNIDRVLYEIINQKKTTLLIEICHDNELKKIIPSRYQEMIVKYILENCTPDNDLNKVCEEWIKKYKLKIAIKDEDITKVKLITAQSDIKLCFNDVLQTKNKDFINEFILYCEEKSINLDWDEGLKTVWKIYDIDFIEWYWSYSVREQKKNIFGDELNWISAVEGICDGTGYSNKIRLERLKYLIIFCKLHNIPFDIDDWGDDIHEILTINKMTRNELSVFQDSWFFPVIKDLFKLLNEIKQKKFKISLSADD
jgi:hypothetical protein